MTLRQRLLPTDIDHRTCQMPFLQSLDQVAIDHRHAAPGIDEQGLGVEALEQRGVIQVMGRRGVGQQVDHIIDLADQTPQVLKTGHFDKRRLLARLAGDTVQLHAKRQQKLRHPLTDIAGPDDQHPPPFQAAPRTLIPLALDLADQARQHLALVAEHVGEHVLGHDLAKDAHRPGQAVVTLQAVSQQRRNAGPGRLQPLRLMALAQQGCQQVRLAQPHRAVSGQPCQFGRVTTVQDFQVRCRLAQQASVEGMILFSDQNTHVHNNLG
ncbi:hypothetical protein D9M71_435760 [compost metagenome]